MYNSSCCKELNNHEFPINPKYFTEDIFTQTMKIPCEKPDMKKIIAINANIEVVFSRLIKTPIAISNAGQKLSGDKLIIELKFSESIKYVANIPCQPVHLVCYDNIFKSVSVIIPCNINYVDVKELLRKDKIKVTPIIEDISAKIIDGRTISQSIIYFVNVTFSN